MRSQLKPVVRGKPPTKGVSFRCPSAVGTQMPTEARKPRISFRRMVLPEPIAELELVAAERILARLVALAFAADHPDLFTSETEVQAGVTVPPPSVLTFVAS